MEYLAPLIRLFKMGWNKTEDDELHSNLHLIPFNTPINPRSLLKYTKNKLLTLFHSIWFHPNLFESLLDIQP